MMNLNKYKLADIAKIEISGVDKKTIEGETPVRLCNFVDVYYNWAVTKEKAKSFMAASAKQTEIDKCSIGKGMVAITKDSETRDDIGVATYIADDFENVVLGYHCALIIPNSAIVNGKWHYKIYCVNGNTGFNLESRIFYFIDLQNEEDYERKESSSAR